MSEASLYRRHRPQSFAEVVGQEHVVRTLSGAVANDKVHHAYLFVGSRGTGKTSMAKILARSLNCVDGPTLTPCGKCESCITIARGTSLDVVEMDAASNRSVDDIRELRDRVGYAPAAGHWKVYILDEAHMLTKEAWNAFLKTLEEPPPNTAFVLATTEPQKVMATIVDRCQRFDFQRPSLEQIGEVVQRVADAEGFEVSDAAVGLIARSATGSFRDALGTLDQLVAYGGPKVETEDVLAVLGAADADLIFGTVDAIAASDAGAALGAVEQLSRSGRDPAQFARDLIAHLRQLLIVRATGAVPDSFSVTIAEPDRLREQASRIGEASMIAAIDSLSAAIAGMREGDEPRLALEVALLKIARPDLDGSRDALVQRIERLEASVASGGDSAASGGPTSPASATTPSKTEPPAAADDRHKLGFAGEADPPAAAEAPETSSEPAGEADAGAEPEPGDAGLEAEAGESGAKATATAPVDVEKLIALWPAVVEHIRESGAAVLSTVFEGAKPIAVDVEEAVMRVGFPASATFNLRKAKARANIERLTESVREVVGERLRPVYELMDPEAEVAENGNGGPTMADEELIDLIKTKFDASEVADVQDAKEVGEA